MIWPFFREEFPVIFATHLKRGDRILTPDGRSRIYIDTIEVTDDYVYVGNSILNWSEIYYEGWKVVIVG